MSETLSYVDQFGTQDVAGAVLVDGQIISNPARGPEALAGIATSINELQQDRRAYTERTTRVPATRCSWMIPNGLTHW